MRIPTLNNAENQYALIQSQYENLGILLAQQGQQKNILHPSDDIILSGHIKDVQDYLQNIDAYKQNATIALNRSTMLESAAQASKNIGDRLKALIINANNDTLSDNERLSIANEIQGLKTELVNTANRQDGTNNYLFSGSNNKVAPYVFQNGQYVYQGDQDNTSISISQSVESIYNQSGYFVFDHFFSGNGKFAITASSGNTGTASTSVGSVTNQAAYVEDTYTLSFVTNSAGHLAYQIVGASTGQVVPVPPATIPANAPDYVQDSAITFNGMSFTVTGTPSVGDSFQVAPSTSDNVFNHLDDLIANLKTPIGTDTAKRAQFHQALSQSNSVVSDVFNRFVGFESQIGERSLSIKNQQDLNSRLEDEHKNTLSLLSDPDMVKIATSISQQMIFIQSTQSTYMKIQNIMMDLMKVIV